MSQFARAKRAALRFSFMSQMFGEFPALSFAPGANGAVVSTPICTAAANCRLRRAFRLPPLETLLISRPVDEQLTARNEPVRVRPRAKEGRPWPMT
jgi:hypothetical protein